MARISTRLIGALVALFLCTLALSFVAWRSLNEQVEAFGHVYQEHVVPLRDLKVISDRFAVDVVDAAHKVRNGNFKPEEGLTAMKAALAEIDQLWPKYMKAATKADERKLIEATVPLLKQAHVATEHMIALLEKANIEALSQFTIKDMYPAIDPGTEKIAQLIDFQLTSAKQEFEESRANTKIAEWKLLFTAAISIVFSLLAGLYLYFGVVRNLKLQISAMNTMGGGALDVHISGETRSDELGDMARALISFRESGIERQRLRDEADKTEASRKERAERIEAAVREFERAAQGIVSSVYRSSEELHSSADRMLGIASRTSDQTSRVAESSFEVSENMQALANAGSELAHSIDEIGRQAEQSSAFASAASVKAKATDTTVKKLSDAGKAVGEVVDLIKSIASQTNLLALNATIEAARAGESGRGFAVVASEVKELATQTTRATDVIAEHVAAIQNAAGESIDAMREISEMIAEINQVASSIAVAVTEQSQATAGISDNVQQVARGTEETSQTITIVNSAAVETDLAAREVMTASENLAAQSQAMRENVDEFLRNVRAA
jgi:methyl-accepting chemotaxis protein